MRHHSRLIPIALVLALIATIQSAPAREELAPYFVGKKLVTQTNLRVFGGAGGSLVIYLTGRIDPGMKIIPPGTSVLWGKQGMRGSEFVIDGATIVISHNSTVHFVQPSHTMRCRRAVDVEDPTERLKALPDNEQKLIKDGEIEEGMSREAVVFSLGAPGNLNHEQMKSNRLWKYHWRQFKGEMTIIFDDDWKIKTITNASPIKNSDIPKPIGPDPEPYYAGKKHFTQTNLRYVPLRGGEYRITLSPNITPQSMLLPLGKEVTFTRNHRNYMVFAIGGHEYYVARSDRVHYINPDLTRRYCRLFDKTNPAEALKKLTPEEQEQVKNGRAREGMSKKAVLLAMGYPSNLNAIQVEKSDIWEYPWERQIMRVVFTDGKVSQVANPIPY